MCKRLSAEIGVWSPPASEIEKMQIDLPIIQLI